MEINEGKTVNMNNEPDRRSNFTFDNLVEAAQNEDWDNVDIHVPQFCNDPASVDWALKAGIIDDDGNVRDLAVSLIEKSDCQLENQNIDELKRRLNQDENPYVQFRAAFALFTHGDRSPEIIEKIRKALEDDAVKEIAKEYLSQINLKTRKK